MPGGTPMPKPGVQSQSPSHKPQQYGGGTTVTAGQGNYSSPNTFTPPPVPAGSGNSSGGTSVNTPSLDLFADNIDRLIDPVNQAKAALHPISVQPGNFYHAYKIRLGVNGLDADDGLKKQCIDALSDLGKALGDLRDGIRTLSGQYKSIEDANSMTAKDLNDAMSSPNSDFNTLIHDAGGDPAVGTGGSQSSGSQSGGSQGGG
ncbi:hypothetical protein ACIGXM_28500 [Kitasatospora sp. NPDC052896]|uniref:hypothetical protein n=1 Tax=Kitasatospora sp. NPDC052896 TaxID=3364061 RepID=UPI0037C69C73